MSLRRHPLLHVRQVRRRSLVVGVLALLEMVGQEMKILLVHPGASMSTADVHRGLKTALEIAGHQIYDYALDGRIERSGAWLEYCWRKGGKVTPRPTAADIQYHSGEPIIARALRIQPDVVLVVSGMYLHPDLFVMMKRAHLNVATLFTESPYDDERQVRLLPYIDVAWTNERLSAKDGVKYIPHACDPVVHSTEPTVEDPTVLAHDVVFVGTGFQERVDLLESVDWTGIDLGLYGAWELIASRSRLRQYLRGEYIDNTTAAALYRKAKVGLNLHRRSMGFGKGAPQVLHAESMNPRAYELAAAGCFTISDRRAELTDVFGDLVPTFTNGSELRALLDRWLEDDKGRADISAQLPTVVAAHTWTNRAAQIIDDLYAAKIGSRDSSRRAYETTLATT